MSDEFRERRKFFDAYRSTGNEQSAKLPPNGIRVTCPCCGYPTVQGGACEICFLCGWEDDGQDDRDANEIRGGPNHGYSLVEARLNFEKHMIMYPPDEDPRFGGPDSNKQKEIKHSIIEAFNLMLSDPPPDNLDDLWHVVKEGEQALNHELKIIIFGPLYEGVPCPYCGKPLRTRIAKQCRHCGTDWHDPKSITKLSNI